MLFGTIVAIVLGMVPTALSAYCNGAPNPNATPNKNPINTTAPSFLRSVPNGHAYVAGTPGYDFYVTHVYGSAYDMGYAQGSLYPVEIAGMLNRTWVYMEQQVGENLSMLPKWLQDAIGNLGLELALDVLIDLTKPHTGAYFYEELLGLAKGANVDYKKLARVHLIGELTRGHCSMIGAWGRATAGGKTLQLRALDWDTDGPFRDYPAVTVYHPTTPGSHSFAIVGLLGFIGAFTGQSSAQLGVSEIGVSFPDTEHFGHESYAGTPFVYLLRDFLEFDSSVWESVKRIQNANRTCNLILGVGDGKTGAARGFASSAGQLLVFDDTNLEPFNATGDTWHPRFQDTVYWGMDWLCPGYSRPLSALISEHYGALTPQIIISDIAARVQTGDVHAAVYDLTLQHLYVSFMARTTGSEGQPEMAYDRPWSQLDLGVLFALPPASSSSLPLQGVQRDSMRSVS